MHECPVCGMACDCDGEDTWMPAPTFCECEGSHEKEDEDEDDYDDESL